MFEQLQERLKTGLQQLTGRGRLTEDNIRDALRDVRRALLEADVALPVAKAFVEEVRARAVGREVLASLNPGQVVIKIVHEELVRVMGGDHSELNLAARPPVVILLAGLQGAGKTTTAAKLARRLKAQGGRRVLMTSVDVYRPAAMDQLRKLAADVEVDYYAADPARGPAAMAAAAREEAGRRLADTLVVDTAGRLHVDEAMMEEIQAVHAAVAPVETLFVVDATAGQDAVNSARAFGQALPLTGVVLTKADGDARGGAALSVRQVTGVPIKFLGTGEGPDALEVFHPDRLASRILGMGDVLSLVEEAERRLDRDRAQALAHKLKKGKGFDLEDLRDQLQQVSRMGGLQAILDKLPGAGPMPPADLQGDRQVKRMVAIINSMTPEERRRPEIIRGSRKRRIARGSGTEVQDVNRLLKQFGQMQKMMKRMGKGGMAKMMRDMQGRFPGLPL